MAYGDLCQETSVKFVAGPASGTNKTCVQVYCYFYYYHYYYYTKCKHDQVNMDIKIFKIHILYMDTVRAIPVPLVFWDFTGGGPSWRGLRTIPSMKLTKPYRQVFTGRLPVRNIDIKMACHIVLSVCLLLFCYPLFCRS
jgi:hypothetical protein